jgi:hypothetical protein
MAGTLRRFLAVGLALAFGATEVGVAIATGSTPPSRVDLSAEAPRIAPGARALLVAQKTGRKRTRGKRGSSTKDAAESTEKEKQKGASPAPDSADGSGAEQARKAELAKVPAAERDQRVETVGRERWKKADPKGKPEVTPSAHFLLFGNLPKAKATAALKALEAQYSQLKNLLSRPSSTPLAWDEKISLYVFSQNAHFTEFVRTVENHEVEPGDQVSANLAVAEPYIAAVDSPAGRAEPAAPKRGPRSKRDGASAGAGRSLVGLMVESFVAGAVAHEGNPPRWLTTGLGAYYATRLERRSPYAARLRRDAYNLFDQGGNSKATEVLGGTARPDDIRALGFAACEWLAAEARPFFGAFVRGMLDGQEKLDDVIGNVLEGNRVQFLAEFREWVATSYGPANTSYGPLDD